MILLAAPASLRNGRFWSTMIPYKNAKYSFSNGFHDLLPETDSNICDDDAVGAMFSLHWSIFFIIFF
jgi:hypothetical protein